MHKRSPKKADVKPAYTRREFVSEILFPNCRLFGTWSIPDLGHGYGKMAALLLDRGANVNHRDEDGNTALHFAARQGRTELVRLLLSRGASVLSRNGAGDTPLDLASRAGHSPVLDLLKSASSR